MTEAQKLIELLQEHVRAVKALANQRAEESSDHDGEESVFQGGQVYAWMQMERLLITLKAFYGEKNEPDANPTTIPEERDFRTYE